MHTKYSGFRVDRDWLVKGRRFAINNIINAMLEVVIEKSVLVLWEVCDLCLWLHWGVAYGPAYSERAKQAFSLSLFSPKKTHPAVFLWYYPGQKKNRYSRDIHEIDPQCDHVISCNIDSRSSFSQTKKNWPERLLPRPSTPQTLTHIWNSFSSELPLSWGKRTLFDHEMSCDIDIGATRCVRVPRACGASMYNQQTDIHDITWSNSVPVPHEYLGRNDFFFWGGGGGNSTWRFQYHPHDHKYSQTREENLFVFVIMRFARKFQCVSSPIGQGSLTNWWQRHASCFGEFHDIKIKNSIVQCLTVLVLCTMYTCSWKMCNVHLQLHDGNASQSNTLPVTLNVNTMESAYL